MKLNKKQLIDEIIKYRDLAIDYPVQRPNIYHYSFLNKDLSQSTLESLNVKKLTHLLSDIKFEYNRGGYRKGLDASSRYFTQGPYELGGKIFKSKNAIREYISSVLSKNINQYFEDDVFLDVLQNWNRDFKNNNYSFSNQFYYINTSSGFSINKKDFKTKMIETRHKPILLMYCPELDDYVSVSVYQFRRDVSYGTYVYDSNLIYELYRYKCYELGLLKSYYYKLCDYPNCIEKGVEYHHHNPTFKQMMKNDILPLISDNDFVTQFGYQKFDRSINSKLYYLDNHHPSVLKLIELHRNNEYYMLCKKHHYKVEQALKQGKDLLNE